MARRDGSVHDTYSPTQLDGTPIDGELDPRDPYTFTVGQHVEVVPISVARRPEPPPHNESGLFDDGIDAVPDNEKTGRMCSRLTT